MTTTCISQGTWKRILSAEDTVYEHEDIILGSGSPELVEIYCTARDAHEAKLGNWRKAATEAGALCGIRIRVALVFGFLSTYLKALGDVPLRESLLAECQMTLTSLGLESGRAAELLQHHEELYADLALALGKAHREVPTESLSKMMILNA